MISRRAERTTSLELQYSPVATCALMYDSSSVVSATLRVGVEDMPFCSPPDGGCQRLPAATLPANIILVGSGGVSTAQRQLSRLTLPKAATSVPSDNNGHLGNLVAQPEHRRAVSYHANEVAARSIIARRDRIGSDRLTCRGNA